MKRFRRFHYTSTFLKWNNSFYPKQRNLRESRIREFHTHTQHARINKTISSSIPNLQYYLILSHTWVVIEATIIGIQIITQVYFSCISTIIYIFVQENCFFGKLPLTQYPMSNLIFKSNQWWIFKSIWLSTVANHVGQEEETTI